MDSEEQTKRSREKGGELGRLAGKFVRNAAPRTKQFIDESRPKVDRAIQDARPRVEKAIEDARPKIQKAVEDYRPRIEQAGRDAVRYAHDHENEIKGMALKGARMRLGPLGMAIDALGIGEASPKTAPENACTDCQTVNASSARFCVECGTRLSNAPAEPG